MKSRTLRVIGGIILMSTMISVGYYVLVHVLAAPQQLGALFLSFMTTFCLSAMIVGYRRSFGGPKSESRSSAKHSARKSSAPVIYLKGTLASIASIILQVYSVGLIFRQESYWLCGLLILLTLLAHLTFTYYLKLLTDRVPKASGS